MVITVAYICISTTTECKCIVFVSLRGFSNLGKISDKLNCDKMTVDVLKTITNLFPLDNYFNYACRNMVTESFSCVLEYYRFKYSYNELIL